MIRSILKSVINAYRLLLSPWIGASCRFQPTCSLYAIEALDKHGAIRGSYLAFTRICRCNPWCDGGIDLVPQTKQKIWFKRLYKNKSTNN